MKRSLDILYASWAEDTYEDVEVTSWVQSLQDHLLTLHECAHSIAKDCAGRTLIRECLAESLVWVIRSFLECKGCMGHLRPLGRGPTRLKRSCLRLIIASLTRKKET